MTPIDSSDFFQGGVWDDLTGAQMVEAGHIMDAFTLASGKILTRPGWSLRLLCQGTFLSLAAKVVYLRTGSCDPLKLQLAVGAGISTRATRTWSSRSRCPTN